jgi:hypothetical protein
MRTKESLVNDAHTDIQVGDTVTFLFENGEERDGEIRMIVQDESTEGELIARVEVEEGVSFWGRLDSTSPREQE